MISDAKPPVLTTTALTTDTAMTDGSSPMNESPRPDTQMIVDEPMPLADSGATAPSPQHTDGNDVQPNRARKDSALSVFEPDVPRALSGATEAQQPPPVPPRPNGHAAGQTSGSAETNQVEQWAEQQDVREVMANVLTQLRWAIRGDGASESGEQLDHILRSV